MNLYQLYHKLYQQMGPQGWWPAESKWEIIWGAILIQNTNWRNVAPALILLKTATQFDPKRIIELDQEQLIRLIRSCGFYKNKSACMLAVCHWLQAADYDLESLSHLQQTELRRQLVSLKGIGNETADALLLYVFDKPCFIVDTYARRLFTALGCDMPRGYLPFQHFIETRLQLKLADYQEFHALIDEFGKIYCKNAYAWQKSFLFNEKLEL
ncbi:MAG: deoxyribonuclease I [Sporolactobacillus sp.]